MNKILIFICIIFLGVTLKAQDLNGNYNPYVNSSVITPTPLMPKWFGESEKVSFNFGNTGSDTLQVFTNHHITLRITLSYLLPDNVDPLLSISGEASTFFSWRYDTYSRTYSGKQITDIPPIYTDLINIAVKVDENSSTPGMNGFNVNITPAPYQTLSNSQPDDYINTYSFTEPLFIYPNPFQDYLIVEYSGTTPDLILSIYDKLGRMIQQEMNLTENYTWQPTDLPPGLYVLKFNTYDEQYTMLVIKL